MTPRSTGILLVTAFVVFLVGAAFWLVREFERPPAEMLQAVHARRRRWQWIHAWMFVGTLLSILAVSALGWLLLDEGGAPLATAGLVLFDVGCLAFLVSLVVRLTATPLAAEELVRTNVVPDAYQSRIRRANALHVGHMYLSYAAFASLGAAMLAGSIFPGWLAWTGVTAGALGVVGFTLLRGGPFAPPIIAHSYGLLVGIVLLLQ